MINIKETSKSYGSVNAVEDVTLSINPGILFGLIGPDGAGKTTLFRIITTLLVPDKGTVTVFGHDTVNEYRKIRQFTGYMPGRFSLYPDLTVLENLSFYATIFNTSVKENYSVIKPVYSFLEPFKDRLSRNLSGGMKQKLALCCALIHNPRLLVLDEPTTGVDAVSRKEFWELLYELKNTGMTILVSTPYMDEAARCDRVALMQQGRIMNEDTPVSILESYRVPLFEIGSANRSDTIRVLRKIKGIRSAYLFGHSIHAASDNPESNELWLAQLLAHEGIQDTRIRKIQPDFEDCFIEAVEHKKFT
jgi:ABC-2 type transport system ATP-binding protein